MNRSRMVPRSNPLKSHRAGRSGQSTTTVRRRMPINGSTARSPDAVRTQVGHGMERNPAATLVVSPSQTPHRR